MSSKFSCFLITVSLTNHLRRNAGKTFLRFYALLQDYLSLAHTEKPQKRASLPW